MLKPYVRRFGPGALAYTTITNAEFKHFFVPGVGSIAYLQCRRYGRRVIMACNDPLCPKALWKPLTERFFAFEPTAYVSHASREYATVLSAMGKIVNHFGIEPIVSRRSLWLKACGGCRFGSAGGRRARLVVRLCGPFPSLSLSLALPLSPPPPPPPVSTR